MKIQRYTSFSGQVDGDKIYGRGSADMKGGVGGGIVALEILKKLNLKLKVMLQDNLLSKKSRGMEHYLHYKMNFYLMATCNAGTYRNTSNYGF